MMLKRALLCVSLMVVCVDAVSQGPAPAPPKGGQEQQAQPGKADDISARNQRGSEQTPLFVKQIPSDDADRIAKRQEHREEEKATNDRLVAYATVGLAFVTLFLALYTAKLWRATVRLGREAKEASERQSGEMQKSLATARDAADAARESADAGKNTVSLMETTAKRQLRAYVAVEQVSFVVKRLVIGDGLIGMADPTTITDDLRIAPKNYGQTPALSLSIYCRASVAAPREYVLDHPIMGSQMLHPGMTQSHHIESPPHRQPFHVWGHLVYRDIYRRWWRTNFWYAHRPENNFTPEDHHNEEKGPYRCESDALQDINEAP